MPMKVEILNLIHPKYGIVRSQDFLMAKRADTKEVLKVIDKWEHRLGKKYYECETKWED